MKNPEKKFPEYFNYFEMPPEAKCQSIKAYRACATGRIEEKSFLNTFEDDYNADITKVPLNERDKPGTFSLSLQTTFKGIKRFATLTSKYEKPFLIAVGNTDTSCGKIKIDRPEKKDSHVHWWLYEGSRPWKYFNAHESNTDN